MQVIGFTSKYYTLWEVSESIKECGNYRYKVTDHNYIKNISFDLEVAKQKYPDAIVDTNLRGHSSWQTSEYVDCRPDGIFLGGKYANEKIEDCCDYSYLLWVFDTHADIVRFTDYPLIEKQLISHGYHKINEYAIITDEQYQQIEKTYDICDEITAQIEKDGYIDLTTMYNPDSYCTVRVKHNNIDIDIEFPNVREFHYQGWPYLLPVDSKDKCKRIKGKTLRITPRSYETIINEYGWGASMKIVVEDFEVMK